MNTTTNTAARNLEIKAWASDFERQRERAEALSDSGPELLRQDDTFFCCPNGRLKLRRLADDHGEILYYERADSSGPSESKYFRGVTEDPGVVKEALGRALGIRGTVKKTRTVFLAGRTRIHFDEVEGLGRFIELEVVLAPGEPASAGEATARKLMRAIGIEESDLVETAYVDLLEERDVRAPRW